MTDEELVDMLEAVAQATYGAAGAAMQIAAARLRARSEDTERLKSLVEKTVALYEAGCDMEDVIQLLDDWLAEVDTARKRGE